MIPVELPDNGESIDEKWANLSNWYLCTVQEVNIDLTFEVKVFGTIIDVEEQLLLKNNYLSQLPSQHLSS